MKLFETDYITVNYFEDKKIVEGIWKSTSESMSTEQFKENMLRWFEEVKKIKNVNILADAREFLFVIVPDIQEWINENVIGKYPDYGVERLGFLVSPDLFAQVSIEQTITEKEQKFETQYFDTQEKVIDWLSIA